MGCNSTPPFRAPTPPYLSPQLITPSITSFSPFIAVPDGCKLMALIPSLSALSLPPSFTSPCIHPSRPSSVLSLPQIMCPSNLGLHHKSHFHHSHAAGAQCMNNWPDRCRPGCSWVMHDNKTWKLCRHHFPSPIPWRLKELCHKEKWWNMDRWRFKSFEKLCTHSLHHTVYLELIFLGFIGLILNQLMLNTVYQAIQSASQHPSNKKHAVFRRNLCGGISITLSCNVKNNSETRRSSPVEIVPAPYLSFLFLSVSPNLTSNHALKTYKLDWNQIQTKIH